MARALASEGLFCLKLEAQWQFFVYKEEVYKWTETFTLFTTNQKLFIILTLNSRKRKSVPAMLEMNTR